MWRKLTLSEPSVLILDDDDKWTAIHEQWLTQAGLKCYATQNAEEAIDIGINYPSIKFALIDEILFIPPIPQNESEAELQDWQGSDVIKEIIKKRADIKVVIITSAPIRKSKKTNGNGGFLIDVLIREESRLRRQSGVIDLIHKQEIDENPDLIYGYLIKQIQHSQKQAATKEVRPKVLLGIGLSQDTLEKNEKLYHHNYWMESLENPISLRDFVRESQDSECSFPEVVTKVLPELQKAATEKIIFIQTPISKKLDPCFGIKANSQSFQIIEFLAQQTEQGKDVMIHEGDYQYSQRAKRKMKEPAPKSSSLKVAIHRLSKYLEQLNVGPGNKLFTFEQGGYRPSFETGIVLYFSDLIKYHHRQT